MINNLTEEEKQQRIEFLKSELTRLEKGETTYYRFCISTQRHITQEDTDEYREWELEQNKK